MVSISPFDRKIDLLRADQLTNFFSLEFVGKNYFKYVMSNWPQYKSVLFNQFDLM